MEQFIPQGIVEDNRVNSQQLAEAQSQVFNQQNFTEIRERGSQRESLQLSSLHDCEYAQGCTL